MITKEYYMKNISEYTKIENILKLIDDNLENNSYETEEAVYIGFSNNIDEDLLDRACNIIKRDTDWTTVYRTILPPSIRAANYFLKAKYGEDMHVIYFKK